MRNIEHIHLLFTMNFNKDGVYMNELKKKLTTLGKASQTANGVVYKTVGGFIGRIFDDSRFSFKMPYRLFIPGNYDPNKSYPLLLALHGMGLRGDDNLQQIGKKAKWATAFAIDDNKNGIPDVVEWMLQQRKK